MVLRCSNGAPFVVIAPEATTPSGIRVEIYDPDDPNTLLDVIPDTWERKWTDPLRGPGSGSFRVSARNPKLLENPDLLAYGNLASFILDEVRRFSIVIEKRSAITVGEGEDVAQVITVQGRGAKARLEQGQVYLSGGLSGDVERGFIGATAGGLIETFHTEAQARGALVGVTLGFDAVNDTDNAPWVVPLNLSERAGTNLLRVVGRMEELAGDFYMSPALVLQGFNERGLDLSTQTIDRGPLVLQPGDTIHDLSHDEDGGIINALIIETATGFAERVDLPSIAIYGRREGFLSLGNTSEASAIDRAAQAVFARNALPADNIGLRVADVDGQRPYVDFNVGDYVLAPDFAGGLSRHRVRALTVSETADGVPLFEPELSTIADELESRLDRWLAAMARGTIGGNAAAVAEPVAAGAEVTAAIDAGVIDGIAAHVAATLHVQLLAQLIDVDVTGVADGDLLTFNLGASEWQPITPAALAAVLVNLTSIGDLADVDTTTTPPADGQALVWDSGAGLWEPASVGGGGGGAVPAWIQHLAVRSDTPNAADDEFNDGTLNPAWALVEAVAGGQTITEARDVLSVAMFETGGLWNSNQLSALLKTIPAGATTITIETAVRGMTDPAGSDHLMFGPIFTNGAAATSTARWMMAFLGSLLANRPQVQLRSGTINNIATNEGTTDFHGITSHIYLRSTLTVSTGVISHAISLDGVSWDTVGTTSALAGITHMGLGFSIWADAPASQIRHATFEYFRVTTT